MTAATANLELWFEFASPYAYLAVSRAPALAAAAGVRITWRPFLLGPIFHELHGSADSPFNRNPASARHMWIDVARGAAKHGVPFRKPSVFPRGSLLATRIAMLAEDEPWLPVFARRIFEASFVDDLDIGAEPVVRRALADLGADAARLIAEAGDAATKDRLRERTAVALNRGIFGAPTVLVGDELYWGNDRLDDAIAAATGAAIAPFVGASPEVARAFAARWLPAWTGDDPDRLAGFYTDDAVYLDPAVPAGVHGNAALRAYFGKLLRRNPAWVWTQREAIPMRHGFVNLWHASIPVPGVDAPREIDGVCLVVLRGDRIARNEVYFDPSPLRG